MQLLARPSGVKKTSVFHLLTDVSQPSFLALLNTKSRPLGQKAYMVYHQEAIISSIQCALSTQIHVAISIPDVEISVSASKGLWGKHMGGDA